MLYLMVFYIFIDVFSKGFWEIELQLSFSLRIRED